MHKTALELSRALVSGTLDELLTSYRAQHQGRDQSRNPPPIDHHQITANVVQQLVQERFGQDYFGFLSVVFDESSSSSKFEAQVLDSLKDLSSPTQEGTDFESRYSQLSSGRTFEQDRQALLVEFSKNLAAKPDEESVRRLKVLRFAYAISMAAGISDLADEVLEKASTTI